jgi:hypothetical protein
MHVQHRAIDNVEVIGSATDFLRDWEPVNAALVFFVIHCADIPAADSGQVSPGLVLVHARQAQRPLVLKITVASYKRVPQGVTAARVTVSVRKTQPQHPI